MSVPGFQISPLPLAGAAHLTLPRFGDARGHFSVLGHSDLFEALGMDAAFCQQNLSHSAAPGTVRGLHFQAPPFAQAKLVTVLSGRIVDALVDARPGSASYGQHCLVELGDEAPAAVFVPRGFLHGFMTLTANTTVLYTVDNRYAPDSDRSIAWDDPALGIDWPDPGQPVTLSDKDAAGAAWDTVGDVFAPDHAQTGSLAR